MEVDKDIVLDDEQQTDESVQGCEGCQDTADNDNPGIYNIKFLHSSETQYVLIPVELQSELDGYVIASSRYGKDLAKVLGPVRCKKCVEGNDIEPIIRIASEEDLAKAEQNKEKEAEAFTTCQQKIQSHKLSMKLVSAHYLTEESKVLFFFTAESRVDFRELVKDLVSIFKMRIELRQIGVRDESRVLGGVAVCGRTYCCHGLTDKLRPVSIKMAKEQNLSLNSMKISGPCGRLLCCLSYEYDFYKEEKSKIPSEGMRIRGKGQSFRVIEVNILSKRVRLVSNEGAVAEYRTTDFEYDQQNRSWSLKPNAIEQGERDDEDDEGYL